jgi:hypothetical protein
MACGSPAHENLLELKKNAVLPAKSSGQKKSDYFHKMFDTGS